jgi:hypothetical protein
MGFEPSSGVSLCGVGVRVDRATLTRCGDRLLIARSYPPALPAHRATGARRSTPAAPYPPERTGEQAASSAHISSL